MFIDKKFLALALLPMFAACVIEDDGDDDAGGTGTNPTATVTVTDPSATETDPTATGTGTTDDPSESETDPNGDTTVGETETETDTGGDAGFCAQACAADADCCNGEPTCEDGLGTYPDDWSCEGGACVAGGCTDDEQCNFGGEFPDNICTELGECAPSCAEDVDCQTPTLEDWTCTGGGGTYCEPPPSVCGSDADCDTGEGVCDVETGVCGCAAEADCGEGSICIIP